MHRLFRPSHMVFTTLVFLLMGGASTGWIGSVAADEARSATLVEGFSIPLPAQGDRGNYSLVEAGTFIERRDASLAELNKATELNLSVREEWYRFEWFDDRMLPTQDGELTLSNRLRYYTGPNFVNGIRAPLIEAGQNVPFAHEQRISTSDPSREEVDMRYQYNAIHGVPCMLRNGLQGKTFDVSAEPIHHSMFCRAPGSGYSLEKLWRPVGIVAGASPAIVVVESHYESACYQAGVRMWLQDGLPYPVRVEEWWKMPCGTTNHGRTTYTLIELERGERDIAVEPYRSPLPELATAVVDGFPNDAALNMPFPLADAVERVHQDEDVASFLIGHPDAYLGYAAHWFYEDRQGRHHNTWSLVWTDGAASMARGITRIAGPVVVWAPVLDHVIVPHEAEPEYQIRNMTGRLPDDFPMPGKQATRFATIETLERQWSAVAGTQTSYQATSWGFSLACQHCHGAQMWIGGYTFQAESPASGEAGSSWLRHILSWNGTRIEGYFETRYVHGEESLSPLAARSTIDIERVPDAPWIPLTPRQVAGATAVAAFVALIYWLAPLAKHGLLAPLFSRIEDHDVLQNSVRRRVHDTINHMPGVHFQELVRTLGISQGALTHHLRRLETAGLIRSARDDGYACYFVKGAVDHRLHAAAALLRAEPARVALAGIVARPGITGPELLTGTAVTQSTLAYHLGRLSNAGLIERRRDGRRMAWHPTQAGAEAVEQGLVS